MADEKYYCHLDSCGVHTNLQLYSLKKAYEEWNTIAEGYQECGDNTENLKEKLVFVVSCIGMSLSQLLGQNAITVKPKLDRPNSLLAAFLNGSDYDKDRKKVLNRRFNTFIEYYDACRHFGRVDGDKRWEKIESLDFDLVEGFMQTALDIWNAVIHHRRTDYIEAEDIKEILGGMF